MIHPASNPVSVVSRAACSTMAIASHPGPRAVALLAIVLRESDLRIFGVYR